METQQIPEASAQGEAKPRSLRGAIDAKCRQCIYDPKAPGRWREQVQGCTVASCPLYEYRPRTAAIRALSGAEQAESVPEPLPTSEPAPERVHSSADDLSADVLA